MYPVLFQNQRRQSLEFRFQSHHRPYETHISFFAYLEKYFLPTDGEIRPLPGKCGSGLHGLLMLPRAFSAFCPLPAPGLFGGVAFVYVVRGSSSSRSSTYGVPNTCCQPLSARAGERLLAPRPLDGSTDFTGGPQFSNAVTRQPPAAPPFVCVRGCRVCVRACGTVCVLYCMHSAFGQPALHPFAFFSPLPTILFLVLPVLGSAPCVESSVPA